MVTGILLLGLGVIAVVIAAGWLYQLWGTARDRSRFPAPGRLIDIGGRRLHVVDSGGGSPAVLLEAGIAASSLNWTRLRGELARDIRVCTYDRASLGWSDAAGSPRLLSRVVDELDALLLAANIPGPLILTGHSFGGLIVRFYATRHPDRVAGLVLVDPLASEEWLHPTEAQSRMLRRGAKLARRGARLARFGVVRFALALLAGGARVIPQLVARAASSESGESAISRLVREVRKMPPESWPIVRGHWCQPKCFLGMASYLDCLTASSAEGAAMGELPPEIPVTIFSAAGSGAMQLAERDRIAGRSQEGKHIVGAKSGHWIHLDEPELVIAAIREMAAQVRTRKEA